MKIKIPIGLASHYANHRGMIRVMAAFCRLKALESSSRVSNWRNRLGSISAFCKFSSRTLESRISEMETMGLLKKEKGDLMMISWDELWTLTNIQCKRRRYWHYDEDKIKCKLEYIFQLLAIKEKKKSMENAYRTRTKNIPGFLTEIKYILGVDYNQPITMQDHLVGLLDAFATGAYSSDQIYMLNAVLPDNNFSCRKMKEYFGYAESSDSGPSYRKKILAKLGLITVVKRSVQSSIRSRSCIAGSVHYSRKNQKTFVRLCDDISPAL